jgi:general secretion pathway protein H
VTVFRPAGFTLLELLLVLAIAGLLMAVTPPLLSSAFPGLQLRGAAREVAAGLRAARGRAIATRSETLVQVDLEGRRIVLPGRARPIQLAEALNLELTTARSEVSDTGVAAIRFFPDGSSTGGRITLSYRQAGYDVDLDWLSGRIRLAPLEPADL